MTKNGRMYRYILPRIIDALKPTNDLSQITDIEDSYEMISAQRFIGRDIARTISEEVDISIDNAIVFVDIIYGHRKKETKRNKVTSIPKGMSSASILEKADIKSKFGKEFNPKWLSGKLLPELKRWGILDSYKPSSSVMLYRINSYMF